MRALNTEEIKIQHKSAYIGGKEINTGERIEVRFPYDDQVIGTIPQCSVEQVQQAFKIAAEYKPKLSRYERQQILLRTSELLKKRRDELAHSLTLELGVCLKDTYYEVERACDVFNFAATMALIDDGEIFSCDLTPLGKSRRIYTMREPFGVISAITPFNHPLNMVAHKVAPALATNNCIVCRPTERTPIAAIQLAEILYEAGLPPEMYQVVTGRASVIGDEMITNPHAAVVTFTGGVRIGKYIADKAGYKRQVLELGGNDPLIILNDLSSDDLARAADLAVSGAIKNSGQRCTAVKRILVQQSVADEFSELVLERAKKVKFGYPLDPTIDLGTVIDAQSAKQFEDRVYAAEKDGAKILYNPGRQHAVLPPITLDYVPHTSELVFEETFGPVVPMIRVPDDDEQVISISNSTAFGLSSGICGNTLPRITRFINALHVGSVNVWEVPGYRIELSPFGGIKDSGNGFKEGVKEAMKSYTRIKTYSMPWPT